MAGSVNTFVRSKSAQNAELFRVSAICGQNLGANDAGDSTLRQPPAPRPAANRWHPVATTETGCDHLVFSVGCLVARRSDDSPDLALAGIHSHSRHIDRGIWPSVYSPLDTRMGPGAQGAHVFFRYPGILRPARD